MAEFETVYEPPTLVEIGDFADLTLGIWGCPHDWFGLSTPFAC
ncbi:lasso RiPP family leader peptide-containing protein [Streptomyces sp. MST-110588]|nr:lasso RiPP family leader peptide-containing protein [Streptomyces sp. MST-110588]UNO43084.1 lasso RiPP family leader peptide-containing protein [Streptomyces sp. MST-110588]